MLRFGMASSTTFCPTCGINVSAEIVESGERRRWRCVHCGFVFKEEELRAAPPKPRQVESRETAPPGPYAQHDAIELPEENGDTPLVVESDRTTVLRLDPEELIERSPLQDTSGPAPVPELNKDLLFKQVIIAEDTALLRQMLKDALIEEGFAQTVRSCAGGEELLQAVAEQNSSGQPVDFAILDVEMPVLNGYQTAVALRAMERGLHATPVPILFLTSHPYDDVFKKVLEYCQPARYLSKGNGGNLQTMASRILHVMKVLRQSTQLP
jgi:CheY-like chemotaxis protein/ribosomal protein S27AE